MRVALVFALFLGAGGVQAQNCTSYHVLHNGMDVIYAGIGAGGTQTADDGLGVFIPGEDLRAATCNSLGDFGVRAPCFRADVCLTNGVVGSGTQTIEFPAIYFVELDGANAHRPDVFTNPLEVSCTGFPLGSPGGFEPYGTALGCSGSFLLTPGGALTGSLLNSQAGLLGLGPSFPLPGDLATMSGTPGAGMILVPDNQLTCGTGFATVVAAFGPISIPVPDFEENQCWVVQFEFVDGPLELNDDIDGLWHYLQNSPNNDQYFAFSNDELNLWQSHTVGTTAGQSALNTFPANDEYCFTFSSVDPNTHASLAPVGFNVNGPYYAQTAGINTGCPGGPGLNPNGGFDVGRGSQTLSLDGTNGVANPWLGPFGSQDAAGTGTATVPSIGFVTWDAGGDGDGSKRLTWISVDFDAILGTDPALASEAIVGGGCVRVPACLPLQALTTSFFTLWLHETRQDVFNDWLDPDRLGFSAFGVRSIVGASNQLPIPNLAPLCLVGLPVVLCYGTSGLKGPPGGPCSGITWDQTVAATSGSKQLFLFD